MPDPYSRTWPDSFNDPRNYMTKDFGVWEGNDVEQRLIKLEETIGIRESEDADSVFYKINQWEPHDVYHALDHASTDTCEPVGYYKRTVDSDTPADGCGGYIPFYLENDANEEEEAARQTWKWRSAADGSEATEWILGLKYGPASIQNVLEVTDPYTFSRSQGALNNVTDTYAFKKRWTATGAVTTSTGARVAIDLPYGDGSESVTAAQWLVQWTDVTTDHEYSKTAMRAFFDGSIEDAVIIQRETDAARWALTRGGPHPLSLGQSGSNIHKLWTDHIEASGNVIFTAASLRIKNESGSGAPGALAANGEIRAYRDTSGGVIYYLQVRFDDGASKTVVLT